MKFPKFVPGQLVCFLANKDGRLTICSGEVGSLTYSFPIWKYTLTHCLTEFPEKELMNFTEAFGEYYERYKNDT